MSNEDLKVVRAMEMYGGSFVKHLAQLALVADPLNFRKIKETWSDYWKKYQKMAADNNVGAEW